DPFATLRTSDACDLPTNATRITCLTYDTHMTSLMTLQPKHSDAPSPVSCLSTSNTLQTPSLVVCNYLISDPRPSVVITTYMITVTQKTVRMFRIFGLCQQYLSNYLTKRYVKH